MCIDVAIEIVEDLSFDIDACGPEYKDGLLHDKKFEEYSYTMWALNEVLKKLEEAKQYYECPYSVLIWLEQESFDYCTNPGAIMFSVMHDVLNHIIDELNSAIECVECYE